MIELPRSIVRQQLFPSKNTTTRFYGCSEIVIDNESASIVSTDPLIVNHEGHRVLFSSKTDVNIPEDCEYAVKTRIKPTRAKFRSGEIECESWIKHPAITNESPEDIVDSWRGQFLYTKEDPSRKIKGLRTPQLGALYSFLANAQESNDRGIIVMPTGTGKTETMLSVLIANQCSKVLVIVPYDPLREQLGNKFINLGILPKFNIVKPDIKYPIVTKIAKGMDDINDWQRIIDSSNVVVSTMSLLAGVGDDIKQLLSEKFSHIFVDEAHHSEAPTWSGLIDSFDKRKVTLFTATPFRNDGKNLQGKFLYTFSLKSAQEQGYYKPIDYLPVREYDKNKADQVIANMAVTRLREDLDKGYNHILMARCSTKARAHQIYEFYKQHEDLSPIVVHSQVENKAEIVQEIKECKHRIIVCVNMLGEGFDLPQMKIAAVHDERQSLPITLQFIGRFTRTSFDNHLGNASLIVNIANPPIAEELRELYFKDSDWNSLLPQISDKATQEEIDFNKLMSEFKHIENSKIPFQDIMLAMSAIIYRVPRNEWRPDKWKEVFSNNEYDYIFGDYTDNGILVITLGKIENVNWGKFEAVQNVTWDVVIIYSDITPYYHHACINTSSSRVDVTKLVEVVFGEGCEKQTGEKLFRCFHGVSRLAVMNFGGRKGRSGDISFKSFYGKDVQDGINQTEQGQLTKNNLFGNGYRNGNKTSVGCSVKGKIWSYMRGNLKSYTDWCRLMGKLIEDESIDPNIVLQNTLKIERILALPKVLPISVDWDAEVYKSSEAGYSLTINQKEYPFFDVDLRLSETTELKEQIFFEIATPETLTHFMIEYLVDNSNGQQCYTYKVSKISGPDIEFQYNSKRYPDICQYFNESNNAPVIFFADGSQLFANNYVKLRTETFPIKESQLVAIDWSGVNIANESQHVVPYVQDSIQYFFSQRIMDDYDILYDDDGSGEMADLIGIDEDEHTIDVHLFHLKYAHGGVVSNSISNFYEVCGQAQKSLKWKDHNNDIFHHLLARKEKKYNGRTCSRILRGTENELERISQAANWKKSIKFHINIVQPALSKSNATEDILRLLGSVSDFIKETGNVELKVYCSE